MSKLFDVIRAGAIGDAFGYQVEFISLEGIRHAYGEEGITFKWRSPVVSDDTQMTLFLLNALLNYDFDYSLLDEEYYHHVKFQRAVKMSVVDWYLTQTYNPYVPYRDPELELGKFNSLHYHRAPGGTCLSAGLKLSTAQEQNKLFDLSFDETPINYSLGCGSIMRTAPISFLQVPLMEIFNCGAYQASVTHGHPLGLIACGYFNVLLRLLADGEKSPFEKAEKILKDSEVKNITKLHKKQLNKGIQLARKKFLGDKMTEVLDEGWTADSALFIAIHCFVNAISFEDCVQKAANHDGDSDSTASLAAQLWAATYGLNIDYKLDVDVVIEHLEKRYG